MKHLIPITIFVLPTVLAQTCDRPALQAIATAYTLSQSQGSLTPLTPYLPTDLTTVAYTENAKPATLAASILATQPLVLAHNRSTLDTAQCATYTELIVTDAKHPYVIGTQIRVAPTGSANLTVGNIETLVTDKGDWLFNASGTYAWAIKENWGVIEEEKRNKRDVIRAAADAYFDYFSNKSVVVPWGTPCDRLEGGSYTGNGSATDSCNVGVPSGVQLTDRRYVVDEAVGAVDVFLSFGGNFSGAPDSHEFRVEGGKIRYVHTMTVQ